MKNMKSKLDFNALKGDMIIAGKLTLICFTAVLLLSVANLLTHGRIVRNNIKTENITNKYLLPNGEVFNKKNFSDENINPEREYYFSVTDASDDIVGYTVSVITNGYGGAMKVMVGFDDNLVVKNAKLLQNGETPGVGKEAERDDYMIKFIGTGAPNRPIPVKKSMLSQTDIDSVTGATITFNGVSSGIKRAAVMLEQELTAKAAGDETSDEQESGNE